MENATDALKMAAAVLIFVGAISLAIFGFTEVRQTAGTLLTKSNAPYYDVEDIRVSENRIVGIETVIPTMYSYFKEGYTILFYQGDYDEENDTVTNITPLPLYCSEALDDRLVLSTLTVPTPDAGFEVSVEYDDGSIKNASRRIYGIDANDEDTRQEFWLHDELHAKYFIQSLVTNNNPIEYTYAFSRSLFPGSKNHRYAEPRRYHTPTGQPSLQKLYCQWSLKSLNGSLISVVGHPLSEATDARFIERLGTYNIVVDYDANDVTEDGSVIEFSNNEVMPNEEGTQKRVIQYIYLK